MASGNPKPRVWWGKKDKKTSLFKRVKNERSDELHFDTLDESNLGDYRCFAQNEEKTSSRNFKLGLFCNIYRFILYYIESSSGRRMMTYRIT